MNRDEDDLSSLTIAPGAAPRLPRTLISSNDLPNPDRPKQVIFRDTAVADVKSRRKQYGDMDVLLRAIYGWPDLSEVWPFKIGIPILGLAAGTTGYFLNDAFRKALYLERFTKLSSYLAMAAFPAVITTLFHGMIITTNILQHKTGCPVCVQVKAASLQLVTGLIYPIFVVPVVSYSTASALKDVYFPKLTKHPRDVFNFTKQVFKPLKGRLGMLAAGQVVLAMGVTYFEQDFYFSKLAPAVKGYSESEE